MKATLSFVVREFDFDDVLVASSGEEKKERRKETNGEKKEGSDLPASARKRREKSLLRDAKIASGWNEFYLGCYAPPRFYGSVVSRFASLPFSPVSFPSFLTFSCCTSSFRCTCELIPHPNYIRPLCLTCSAQSRICCLLFSPFCPIFFSLFFFS